MRTVIEVIIVLVALGLATAGPALAQETAEEALQLDVADDLLAEASAIQTSVPVSQNQYVVSTLAPPHAGAGTVLVIPGGKTRQEDLAAITEDMSVMSRIFDKKLGHAHSISISEFDYWSSSSNAFRQLFTSGKPATEAIYLADYGALFLMRVDFPLSALPKPPEQKKPEKDADEVWTQTKREIYTPQEVIQKTREILTPLQQYDAQKVENLKTTLLKALKHAANIRNLKPDDSVILTVNGQGSEVAAVRVTGEAYTSKAVKTSSRPPAALTIRAKKSDVDAYSKSDLDLDEFRKKVVMFIY